MFLYKEDYSYNDRCVFIYRNIQKDLYAKVDLPNKESHHVANKLGMKEIGPEKNEVTGGDMTVYKLASRSRESESPR